MENPDLDLDQYTQWEDDLPYPHWRAIEEALQLRGRNFDDPAAWSPVRDWWLEQIVAGMGDRYDVYRSDRVNLIASSRRLSPRALLYFAEACESMLVTSLPEVAYSDPRYPIVILAFDSPDDYYRYGGHFHPEGRSGGSGGMHIREGYTHLICHGYDQSATERIVAHELTHYVLMDRSLPLWIEEGLAQMFEHQMTGMVANELTPREVAQFKRVWRRIGLDIFWHGDGFYRPGKLQRMSYELAEVLMRLLFLEHQPRWFGLDPSPRKRLMDFLCKAAAKDCGASAAARFLGTSLSKIAEKYLGKGSWSPTRYRADHRRRGDYFCAHHPNNPSITRPPSTSGTGRP